MRVAHLVAAGLVLGAAAGFVLALLRPRAAIDYRLSDEITLPDAGSRPMVVLPQDARDVVGLTLSRPTSSRRTSSRQALDRPNLNRPT